MNDTTLRDFLSACRLGKHDIVRAMLADPNIDVNARRIGGQWALREAVENAKVDIVEMLLAHPNIDVNQIDIAWDSALHRAVVIYGGKGKQILDMLLGHPDIDANIAIPRLFGGMTMTPLEYAREHAHAPNRDHAIAALEAAMKA
jgi:serine/threonine-protein phosphatase 6 regulatory ankyrin repeat subunit B